MKELFINKKEPKKKSTENLKNKNLLSDLYEDSQDK